MNRGIIVGLLAICCLSLSTIVMTPRTASALMQSCDCDAQLANCVSNAIDNYDSCICNTGLGFARCAVAADATTGGGLGGGSTGPALGVAAGGSPVRACVEQLQGDVFKCTLANYACHLRCDDSNGRLAK